jgi:hypothetical protein
MKDEEAKADMCAEVIKRQDIEIERLREENKKQKAIIEAIDDAMNPLPFVTDFDKAIKTAKSEAVKEFAEKVKEDTYHYYDSDIDELVKEMEK